MSTRVKLTEQLREKMAAVQELDSDSVLQEVKLDNKKLAIKNIFSRLAFSKRPDLCGIKVEMKRASPSTRPAKKEAEKRRQSASADVEPVAKRPRISVERPLAVSSPKNNVSQGWYVDSENNVLRPPTPRTLVIDADAKERSFDYYDALDFEEPEKELARRLIEHQSNQIFNPSTAFTSSSSSGSSSVSSSSSSSSSSSIDDTGSDLTTSASPPRSATTNGDPTVIIDLTSSPDFSSNPRKIKNTSQAFLDSLCSKNFFTCEVEYPTDFPALSNSKIAGITLNRTTFETLAPTQLIDDNIINAFFTMVSSQQICNERKIIPFETFLVSMILNNGKVSGGFAKWIMKAQVWNSDVWLLPVHHESPKHWTLFVVYLKHQTIIYFDSLNNPPRPVWIYRLCAFMDRYNSGHPAILWENWSVYIPDDIPHQRSSDPNSRNNCGAHICSWAWNVCAERCDLFYEAAMNNVRKIIATILAAGTVPKQVSNNKIKDKASIFTNWESTNLKVKPINIYQGKKPFSFRNTIDFIQTAKNENFIVI